MRRVSAGERGLLSCKVQEGDNFIYVNKVGTFGVACTCASYWWSRISGAGVRLVHELAIEILIFADDIEAIAADAGGRRGITLCFLCMSSWDSHSSGQNIVVDCVWIGLEFSLTIQPIALVSRPVGRLGCATGYLRWRPVELQPRRIVSRGGGDVDLRRWHLSGNVHS